MCLCGEKLLNESIDPSKLNRHFNTKHSHLSGYDLSRFLSSEEKQTKAIVRWATISEKALVASYMVAKIIVKTKL